MTDDLLQRATKALREQGGAEPPADRAAFMRARVLSQAKRSSKLRPQGIWQWAAVVSLGFFVSTAMAQVIAVQLPRVIEALRHESQQPPQATKPKQNKPSRPVQPKAAAPVAPTPEPAALSVTDEPPAPDAKASPAHETPKQIELKPAPSPHQGKRTAPKQLTNIPAQAPASQPMAAEPEPLPAARTEAPAEPSAEPTPSPKTKAPEPAELALFRRAQALHLAHDPRAIEAWDAFLRIAGSSALAPEARYNRALGLVRASRFAEARRALLPFAAGEYGSYRKDEAQALLARLPK